jgi:hypothetical protein
MALWVPVGRKVRVCQDIVMLRAQSDARVTQYTKPLLCIYVPTEYLDAGILESFVSPCNDR